MVAPAVHFVCSFWRKKKVKGKDREERERSSGRKAQGLAAVREGVTLEVETCTGRPVRTTCSHHEAV